MQELNSFLESTYRPATVKRYLRAIDSYVSKLGREQATYARYHDIVSYIGELRKQNYSTDHIQTELSALKVFYRFLVRSGIRSDHPIEYFSLADGKRRGRSVQFQELFSQGELELLLNRPNRYRLLENRNKLIISLYIYQGLRSGEMARLRLQDVDIDAGTVFVRASAKLNSRVLVLQPNQVQWLLWYREFDRPALLKSVSEILLIGKLGNAEKGEGCHYLIESQRGLFLERTLNPKTIRQSVIVNWFKQGFGVKKVQLMAGHKYPSTTEIYRPTDLTAMLNAVEQFHPLGG